MTKEKILVALKEDEKEGNGEVLRETEEGVEYYDYEWSWNNHTVFFRDEKYCTKEKLKELIFISEKSRKYGITEEYIASILADAYKDCMVDMMTTLRAIAIIHTEDDLKDVFQFTNIEQTNIDLENCVGINIFDAQICIINEGEILKTVFEINEGEYGDDIYLDGIGITVIHECRHQMLDCNFLLSEEEYPVELASEEEVESFSCNKWNEICKSHHLKNENLKELKSL